MGFIAANPVAVSADDPTFEPRCAAVVTAVAAVQRRADAALGRWARPGGPADRRVLDIACGLMLAAVRTDIEMDIRRTALLAGIGRDTARVALHRLAADGWLSCTAASEGIHGAHWALGDAVPQAGSRRAVDELSTAEVTPGRSLVHTRPQEWLTLHAAWRSHLAHRTSAVLHDALTATGLGHHTARVYQALTTTPVDILELITRTGYSSAR